MSDSVGLSTGSRVTIVEHILEQGQRLRNAMVKSILDNDPLYVDKFDSVNSCHLGSDYKHAKSSRGTGDTMSGEYFEQQCSCQVCSRYRKLGLLEPQYFCDNSKYQKVPSLDLHEEKEKNENLSEQITKSIQECYRAKAKEYFKYVNSLKIVIHSLVLNQAGNRKASHSSADLKYKVPVSSTHSYFVEYSVPDFLVNSQQKTGSKVDTGLSGNLFRICSKKLYNEEIYFKHSSIHDIVSLLDLNLQEVNLKFQISSRTMKQKTTNVLGYATFNMASFEITKHLSCAQNFPIVSDGLVMGAIKISFQLGCGRMYFGKEFVELVLNNTKIEPIPSQRSDSQITFDDTPVSEKLPAPPKEKVVGGKVDLLNEKSSGYITSQPESNRSFQNIRNRMKNKKVLPEDVRPNLNFNRGDSLTKETRTIQDTATTQDQNKTLLYGLLYISEVNYFGGPINSYLSCQAFSQETLCSRVVYKNKNPVFNYFQKVPFLFNNDFLTCMRDNSIVVEFWERTDEDVEFGISQLSLHQFYFAYKDPAIAETLFQNRLPVTISDWWEPICSPVDGTIQGQMKVIVSVGTQIQIQNLEIDRGLRNDTNSVTYIPFASKTEVPKSQDANEIAKKSNNQNPKAFKRPGYLVRAQAKTKQNAHVPNPPKDLKSISPKIKLKNEVKTIDIGIQSDIEMEPQKNPIQNEPNENLNQNIANQHQMQDMLQNFLSQLLPERKAKVVENATNTEESNQKDKMLIEENLAKMDQSKLATNTQLRKTSDLLDSLKDAFKLQRGVAPKLTADANLFKAHVIIEGALHLPCKRRCKLRKYKRKHMPQEETLPSTYVTYETVPGASLKVTPVVLKSTSPHWDFRSDVLLPGEMLTNSQKRFLFKVWRKNNSNVNEPNLQTDVVLGFAALDLTVLLAGLPGIQGWFNIVDFSSKCNGQIKIHVTPLENISRFNKTPSPVTNETENNFVKKQPLPLANKPPQEEPTELLGRALKRKFSELEEITQRLRSRLADVTNNDSEESNDEFADEFEKDINNLCVEDDYNMIDLLNISPREQLNSQYQSLLQEVDVNTNPREGELTLSEFVSRKTPMYGDKGLHNESFAKSSNDSAYYSTRTDHFRKPLIVDTSSSSTTLTDSESQGLLIESPSGALTSSDMQLIAGRQRIHNLLEKLTLLTNIDEASNRHVSGCSVSNKTNETSKSLVSDSDRRLNLEDILNPALFNQLCSFDSTPSATEPNFANAQSSESNLAQFSNFRYAPEGAGNNVDGASNIRKDN